jgi:heme exporter protein A
VALARVLAGAAPLWLLDEPTVGLDAVSVVALERSIASHRADGGMVVAATHTALDLGSDTVSLDPAKHAGAVPEPTA